ncbi:MAG: hypothetical protein HQM12_04945 [SAR324 cluster bacterium]|nr:hypothetical protein [SAR324 cluster bacterium]MBF0349506.1 hypothetical protein [SAR324 cluster bacterium]
MFDTIIHSITEQLQQTVNNEHITLSRGLDILEQSATSYEQVIVVNLLRESLTEVIEDEVCTTLLS